MLKDIEELRKEKYYCQVIDLTNLYFYKYIEPNIKKLEQYKKIYIKKYKFLDNYV